MVISCAKSEVTRFEKLKFCQRFILTLNRDRANVKKFRDNDMTAMLFTAHENDLTRVLSPSVQDPLRELRALQVCFAFLHRMEIYVAG